MGKYNLKIEFSWNNINCFLNSYQSRRRKIQEAISLLRSEPLYNHGLLSGHNISFSPSTKMNLSFCNKINLNPKPYNRFFFQELKTLEIS